MTISKYSKRPKFEMIIPKGRYESFNLKENPFPAFPFLNPNSNDARNNGEIYEPSIREQEYNIIEEYSNYTKYNNNFGRAMMPIPQELY